MSKFLRTVFGDIPEDKFSLILPHEHIFTDLRGPSASNYAQEDPQKVITKVIPYLREAASLGVTALVECSTTGVGRNIEIIKQVAAQTKIHLIVPTGIYAEAFVPDAFRQTSIASLTQLWTQEIEFGIGLTDIKAGFIKVAVSDNGITPLEVRNLRAAARTSQATGAVIACHTIGGQRANEVMTILKEEGLDLARFIWVHADSEPNLDFHKAIINKGGYIEFDSIGQPATDHDALAKRVQTLIGAGAEEKILLSHDAGWFQPGRPQGEPEHGFRGYTDLLTLFIPLLQSQGLGHSQITRIIEDNPKTAFGLPY